MNERLTLSHTDGRSETLDRDKAMVEFVMRGGSDAGWSLAAPDAAPAPAPAPTVSAASVARRTAGEGAFGGRGPAVVQEDQASADRDKAALISMGLSPGRTIVPVGTTLAMSGLSTWRRMHADMESSPRMVDAVGPVLDAIASENRRRRVVQTDQIRLVEDSGRLLMTSKRLLAAGQVGTGIGLEAGGLAALMRRAPHILPTVTGGAFYQWSAEEIAHVWNSRIDRLGVGRDKTAAMVAHLETLSGRWDWKERSRLEAAISRRNAAPPKTLLQVRDGADGAPVLWSAVGPKFPWQAGAEYILRELAKVAPEAHASLVYVPDGSQLSWSMQDMGSVPPVVGEVYARQAGGSSRDDGLGRFQDWLAWLRALCLNLTTETLTAGGSNVDHDRGAARMMADIARSLQGWQASSESFDMFRRDATKAHALDAGIFARVEEGATLREAMRALMKGPTQLRDLIPGGRSKDPTKRDAATETVLRAAQDEGLDPSSPASVYMATQAITRWGKGQPEPVRVQAGAVQRQMLYSAAISGKAWATS